MWGKQIIAILFLAVACRPSAHEEQTAQDLLKGATTWMYQLQGLDSEGALDTLAKTEYPLLVLEPTRTVRGSEGFDTKGMIGKLRTTPKGKRRVILAYIDIGEAEGYRTYWQPDWTAPTGSAVGSPDFILAEDPGGWAENYPVAYWDVRWKGIWLGTSGLVSSLAKDGFDGVYLDWVEAYDDDNVAGKAKNDGKNPAPEMVTFTSEIKKAGQAVRSDFLVVAQNAPYLLDFDPSRYAGVIDGLGVEDTWFGGGAGADWGDAGGGDIPNGYSGDSGTEGLLTQYKKYLDLGIPVFSIDYCLDKANADYVYDEARKRGLVPLVTQVSLSRITETPPP